MCGIAGKVSLVGKRVTQNEISLMTDKIFHRGPDDEGVWVEENVGLGSRRLAIIDLSAAGHMPMFYNRKRYVITYNGEIYNFDSEKQLLIKKGYKFRSETDTEVILALYQEYGINCLGRLRGMFAFAIYDRKEKTLFAARDRLGKKPFKYFFNNETFIFASELKAILTQKEVKAEPDFVAIHHYLTLGYVPAPMTGFVGIQKLEPGHYLWLDLKKRAMRKERYWKLKYETKQGVSEKEWKRRILHLLEESTRLRMISDVPVGAFLSGGVDSSSVVAMMSRFSNQPVRTFAIGYDDLTQDETYYARLVSDHFGTEHTTLRVEPESVDILPELAYQYEEPFADNSMVVSHLVSKLAKKYVTVALNGDGGDENFAGYGRYNKQKWYSLIDRISVLSRPEIGKFLENMAAVTGHKKAKKLWWIWNRISGDRVHRYLSWYSYFLKDDKEQMYNKPFLHLIKEHATRDLWEERMRDSKTKDPNNQVLYADLTTYLPDDLLTKMDLASMSVSLEARSPLLDHELVELAAKIPFELKVKGFGKHKYIFKEALRGLLPDEILDRPKRGFTIPIDSWFKGKLKGYSRSILLDKNSHISQWIKSDVIKKMIKDHGENGNDFAPKLWSLLTLELWWKAYFK